MIQESSEWFPVNHFDWILTVDKINISGIGECELQAFPYQDDTNPPTIFIVADWGIVCGLRLDKPLFWGREYKFTDDQKKEINDLMDSVNQTRLEWEKDHPVTIWHDMKIYWKMQNDRLEKIKLPDIHPDYTKLP